MAGDKEVKLVLTAEDNITSAIKKVTEVLGETGLGQAITAVSTSFMALKQGADMVAATLGKVYGEIAAGVNDAAEAEVVNKRLAMSMASIGQYSEQSFTAINEWAGALENVSGVSDETYRNLVALGMQQGLNTEQSMKAAEAARNLSAATGQDLDGAFRQMTMTLSGSAGRLAKFIPELRNLTKEELENGKAIEVISKKYDNFANSMDSSFKGARARLDAQIGNIMEAFGRMIAQNPAVIAGIDKLGKALGYVSAKMDELSTFVINNWELIKTIGIAFTVASVGVGIYAAATVGATSVTNLLAMAQIALKVAMAATPWGLAVIGITALITAGTYLYKNIDMIAGALKFGLGKALEWIMTPLGLYLQGISMVVGVFNKDWAASIQKASESMKGFAKEMQDAGSAQMKAAEASKKVGTDMSTNAMLAGRAVDGLTEKITAQEQELNKLRDSYSKAVQGAEAAFGGLKDLMPKMNLEKFNEDAKVWQTKLAELKKNAEDLKVKISLQSDSAGAKEELTKIEQQIRFTEEAGKALKIKSTIEAREATLKEEKIRLDQLKNQEISVGREILEMRVAFSKQMRDQSIQVETDRILRLRGLESADAQAGVDRKTQALLNANQVELNAYKAGLEAQKAMALSIEEQKQLELANLKKSTMVGGAGGAAAGQDVEVLQARQKQGELAALRDQNIIDEATYQEQLTQLRISAIQSRAQQEIAMNAETANLLGTSQEALAMKLEQSRLQNEMELAVLMEKRQNEQLTEDQFKIAKEEAERAHFMRMEEIQKQNSQKEIEYYRTRKESWNRFKAEMVESQRQYGKVKGSLIATANSEEMAMTSQALGNLSTLTQSHNKKQFEVGKAAAIANAWVSTYMGAAKALAMGPIMGPILAATMIAAGAVQVANISQQKMSQAHGGIDNIPQGMDNSTFLLKAGERVIAPQQNVELGKAIEKINSGNSSGNNITINIAGNADDSTVEKIKTAVLEAIRDKSERGTPIINAAGVYA